MVERFTVRLALKPGTDLMTLGEFAHLTPVLQRKEDDGTVLVVVSVLADAYASAASYVLGRLQSAGVDGRLAAA